MTAAPTVTSRSVVLLGGPGSGKTCYLGALWSTAKRGREGDPLKLRGKAPASAYLDLVEHAMEGCERVPRTNRDDGERIELSLDLDGTPIRVDYVDLSGETFNALVTLRSAPGAVVDSWRGADSIMLFLHPNEAMAPHNKAEMARLYEIETGIAAPQVPAQGVGDVEEVADEEIWDAAHTSVRVVELLQLAIETADAASIPIVVVVSAWDLLEPDRRWGTSYRPGQWIESRLPFLFQFLESNAALRPWVAYGVSAQGADFGNEELDESFLVTTCDKRCVVVDDSGQCHDIAVPLRWLVGEGA